MIFLYGFLRRDYGAAGLYDLQADLSWQQLTITSVCLTLFVPCVAQLAMIIKEHGIWIASLMIAGIISLSFSVGMVLKWILI